MGYKLKFVLSDLHIGAGHTNNEDNPLDDFTATKEFVDLLHQIWHESERDDREVELIINGDCFAFLQVPAVNSFDPTLTYPREAYLDSSDKASVKRLNIVAQRNPAIFNALSDFIHVENPQRRITLIKGNHDVSLYWPGVKSRLREILGASGTRASLLRFADEFVSREKIYVEHGHQRAEKMNGYHDSFDPRSTNNPAQLYYPTGSRFVVDFINKVKPERWFVDHIKPVTTLIWYAFKWDFHFACRALAEFIRHTPALVVNSSFNLESGSSIPPNALLQKLESKTIRDQLAQRYAADREFRQEFHQQIQNYLEDAIIDNKGEFHFPSIEVGDDSPAMGQAVQEYQQNMLCEAAQTIVKQEGAKIVLFGHTHHAVEQQFEDGGVYINTGSWVEDFTDASPQTWSDLFDGKLKPSKPRSLPYVRIDYDNNDTPTATLLDFNQQEPEPPATPPPPQATETKTESETPGLLRKIFNVFGSGS